MNCSEIQAALDRRGAALLRGVMAPEHCAAIAGLYAQEDHFRSHVVMSRYGFGQGEYRYFAYPLPPLIQGLRSEVYAALQPIAAQWAERLGQKRVFPARHADYLAECASQGQTRPTPLLLRYGPGDYNCLHQDLYGEMVFPLQMAILLSRPGTDFTGGEFVITDQRPRMQSRAMVMDLRQGDAVIFAVRERPVRGARGDYRTQLRHGVSEVTSGQRFTLGVIFHDAR